MAHLELQRAAVESSDIAEKFSLTGRVISGNFASTILVAADRTDESREVVVKVLMKSELGSELERRCALEEAAVHFTVLPHPNCVRLLAAEESPEAIMLVTPLMPDGDLWGLMQYGQTFGEAQVKNCAGQMLSALRHLHDVCRLIHADIKPQNFLLSKAEGRLTLQLCDFGFAERPGPDGLVPFYMVRGTSGWLSPEMLHHEDYGFGIDLFGVGLILFRMLGGYAPFDPPSKFQATVEYDERCWCHVAEPCKEFVSKLLSLDPRDRGTAAEACGHAWVEGPAPEHPTEEQLAVVASCGPLPDFSIEFWPADKVPDAKVDHWDADMSSTAVRSHSGFSDDDVDGSEFSDGSR